MEQIRRELYLKDIENRHNLRGDNVMSALLNILASSVGSLTNPTKLANTFSSNVVKDRIKLWCNEKGIVVMDIMDFLLKPDSLDL